MTNRYPPGDTVTLSVAFVTVNGNAPVDPGTISLSVKDPNGTQTNYSYPSQITRQGTGLYSYELIVNTVGVWTYKFTGSGSGIVVASFDQQFSVIASALS